LEHGTPGEIEAVESGEAALTPTEQRIRERLRELDWDDCEEEPGDEPTKEEPEGL